MKGSFIERGGLWVVAQSGLLLAAVGLAAWFPGDWSLRWVSAVGAVLLAGGGAIGIAGILVLDRNRTPFPKPRAGAPLVQHGVYAWMRHPLYMSVMLSSVGWALIWQSKPALGIALLLIPFFDAKARREERWLTRHFAGYADYQRRVRRFVPRLY